MNTIDILFESANDDFYIGTYCDDAYFTEAEKEGFIKSGLDKIKKAFEVLCQKIKDFFTSKKYKDTEEDGKNAIKKDPSLGKKTTKMPNYDKLHKLGEDTIKELNYKGSNPKKIMAKYKKQRDAILGAGAAVVVSLTALLANTKSKAKKRQNHLQTEINRLNQYNEEIKNKVHDLENENRDLEFDNTELKADLNSFKNRYNDIKKENEKYASSDKTLKDMMTDNRKLKAEVDDYKSKLTDKEVYIKELDKRFKFTSDIIKELLAFTFQETSETTKKNQRTDRKCCY